MAKLFSKGLHHFTFPPTVSKGYNCSQSLSKFIIICLFDYSHPMFVMQYPTLFFSPVLPLSLEMNDKWMSLSF